MVQWSYQGHSDSAWWGRGLWAEPTLVDERERVMMKKRAMVAVLALGLMAFGIKAQMVSIIQLTDMRGEVEFLVLNREEHNALTKELTEEMKLFQSAMMEAKNEWDAEMKELPPKERVVFQGNRIKPRSARKIGADFPDRDKAEKRKGVLEERLQVRQAKDLAKNQRKISASEAEKNAIRERAFELAFAAVTKKLGEKLGRPVPAIGLFFEEPKKEEKPTKEAKKEAKKEEKEQKQAKE